MELPDNVEILIYRQLEASEWFCTWEWPSTTLTSHYELEYAWTNELGAEGKPKSPG